jgi:molybdopterin converting factor small subunit
MVATELERNMKIAIVPHFEQLKILVNDDGLAASANPVLALHALFAPWPDSREQGFAELEVEGDTLRAILAEVGSRYKQAGVDFEPISPITKDIKPDYDVFVNGQNYVLLDNGLEAKLKGGDEVKVLSDTMWS